MTTIRDNLQAVRARVDAACVHADRDPASVRLLAVSKTWPATAVREAAVCGQVAFGENYVQEALAKIDALADPVLEWHFIGPLQSNKTRPVAERFAWVHSVDRLKIAERLSAQRPESLPSLRVCIEVNVSGEASKSGCDPAAVAALAQAIARLPRIELRGLMAIPAPCADAAQAREPFARLREMRDALNASGYDLDTLSMGMSGDLEAAIAEGATLVRVGTAIFGERT